MSGRKVTGLPLPDTPKEAPPEIHGLVDAIERALAESETIEAARVLGRTFDYLTRYFAAVAGGVAIHLGLESSTEIPAEFEQVRIALKDRLGVLGQLATDPNSKMIRSVFFVGATRKVPTPRRHARLLDLGGIPIRGYRGLTEWVAIEPGTSDLATNSKANRELLRYLPILKEWLTATASFFLDAKDSVLQFDGPNTATITLTLDGTALSLGPIEMPDDVVALLPKEEETEAPEAPPVPKASPVAATEEASQEEAPAEEMPAEEASVQEAPAEVAPAEVAPAEETAAKEAPVKEAPPEEAPVKEAPSEEASVEEAPAEEASVEEAPAEEAPAEEASAEEAPAEEAPAEEAPAEEAPAEEAPAEEAPAEEAPSEEASAQEAPAEEAPAEEAPAQEAPAEEAPSESGDSEEPGPVESGSDRPIVLAKPKIARRTLGRPGASTEDLAAVTVAEEEPVLEEPAPQEKKPEPEPEPEPDPEDSVPKPLVEIPAPFSMSRDKEKRKKEKERNAAAAATAALVAKDEPMPYPWVTGPPPEFFDEIPVEADYPEVLAAAINDLNGAVEANDSLLICGQMQRCFDLMIQFFGGIAGAIIYEIDADQLFDFELEDGRFDLETKLEFVVNALAAMEEYWEGNDVANLVWDVFYDTLVPATDPTCAYLHTRLLGVEGLVPDPLIEFREILEIVPGKGRLAERSACRETAHRYLPILDFWLENATPLFLECEIDFVEEDGGKALSWAASISGTTLDGTPSGLWLEVDSARWNLPRPELAPIFVVGDAPEVILPIVDDLNNSLETSDFAKAGLSTRVLFDFLVQYFAGCAAALWRETGEMNPQAQDLYTIEATLPDKERLLMMSLAGVSSDTEVGSSLSKLFSKGSLQYRALSRRGQPAGMASLSEWAAKREEITEEELLVYLPTLRSWLGAANLWFSAGEQLFEEPTEDGRLEGVVAFGDEFLEMVDPEFIIALPEDFMAVATPVAPEKPEGEVEEKEAEPSFTGPILPDLVEGPPVLVGHLGRLLESAEDRRATSAWLGSAFEYLIQYYAGLLTTVLGGADAPLPSAALAYFSPKASLRERETLLVEAISRLKESAEGQVQENLRSVFVNEVGDWRHHAKFIGVLGAGSLNEEEMLLSYWCRQRHQVEGLSTEDYRFAVRALSSWVEASKQFFNTCEHYAEDPGTDGQEEIVLELSEDYFDMVLPDYAIQVPARGYYEVLYRESDYAASQDVLDFFPEDVRPELLGPQSVELGGIAPEDSGEILLGAATMELGGELFAGADAYDSSDLFAGAAQPDAIGDDEFAGTPTEEKVEEKEEKPKEKVVTAEEVLEALAGRRRKKKRKSEKGSAVLALLKKERLEKARRRAEARKRKAASEPTKLQFTLAYKGLKNSKQLGGRGHFGVIEIKNGGGGELKGTVEAAHPCVRVNPARIEGNEVRVTYQVDPSDMPSTGRVGIVINTQDDAAEIRLDQLVPSSWWSERSLSEAVALVSAPAILFGVFVTIFVGFLLAPSLEPLISLLNSNKVDTLPLPTHLKLWALSLTMILPGVSLVPYLCRKIYSKLDFSVQEEGFFGLPVVMMLPTLFTGLMMYSAGGWGFRLSAVGLLSAPALATKLTPLLLFTVLNIAGTAFFTLQTTTWWEANAETGVAKTASRGYWALTILVGVVATLLLS